MITPREVRVSSLCICSGTLGRVELETVAACITLYHWEHSPDEWIPISRRQIADWIPTSALLNRAAQNPFWQVDIAGFIDAGYIEGWNTGDEVELDSLGVLTQKFFGAISQQPTPKRLFDVQG